jgi:translation elongation factor EF-4
VLNKIDCRLLIRITLALKSRKSLVLMLRMQSIVQPRQGWVLSTCWKSLISKVPPPKGDPAAPLQALIVDSWFDNYVGVVMLVRIVNGTLRPKDKILFMATEAQHLVESVGVFTPKSLSRDQLSAGQVGFVIAGIKELKAAKVGDTITIANKPATEPLPGFKEVQPQVFAGLFLLRQISTMRYVIRWKN